jgi:hypothetical protein
MGNTSAYMQPSTYSSLDNNVHGVFTVKPEVHALSADLDAGRDPGLLGCIGGGICVRKLVLGWLIVVVKAGGSAEAPGLEAEGVLLKEDKAIEHLQEAGLGVGEEVNSLGFVPSVYDSLGLLLSDKELPVLEHRPLLLKDNLDHFLFDHHTLGLTCEAQFCKGLCGDILALLCTECR